MHTHRIPAWEPVLIGVIACWLLADLERKDDNLSLLGKLNAWFPVGL